MKMLIQAFAVVALAERWLEILSQSGVKES